MSVLTCASCESPSMRRDDNPVVYDTLMSIPIKFCECNLPSLQEIEYSKAEMREIYWLATEPTRREGNSISIALPEKLLNALGWMVSEEEELYLTKRGRKLLPLMLLVANELHI